MIRSVFAWTVSAKAEAVEQAMSAAFAASGVAADSYRAPVASEGVKVIGAGETLVAA